MINIKKTKFNNVMWNTLDKQKLIKYIIELSKKLYFIIYK